MATERHGQIIETPTEARQAEPGPSTRTSHHLHEPRLILEDRLGIFPRLTRIDDMASGAVLAA